MGEAFALLALLLFAASVFTVRLASPLLGQQVGFLVGLVANVLVAGLLFGGQLLLSGLPARLMVLAVRGALISAASYAVGAVFRSAALDDWSEPVFGGFVGAAVGTVAYAVLHNPLWGASAAPRATRPLASRCGWVAER